jgi:hypothetical protein
MYLITRADWDGLVCAVFLTTVESLARIEFAHPRDMQEGNYEVADDAIIANLPYHPRCAMWFDHHLSEEEMATALGASQAFKGKFAIAPSAARLVYEYYNDPRLAKYAELLVATDKYDSAHLSMSDVLNPQGYIRLAYTMDPRTSLNDINWKDYFFHLLGLLKDFPIETVLADPQVAHMLDRIRVEDEAFQKALRDHSRVEGNMVVTDFRGFKDLPAGNRFFVHALYPGTNIAARIFTGKGNVTVLALGRSIFKRDCKTNIGELLARYGGGGHKGAGTAQLYPGEAEAKLKEILEIVKANG